MVLKVITKNMEACPRFRRWIPGLSMKEHLDMEYMEKLQESKNQRLKEDRDERKAEKKR